MMTIYKWENGGLKEADCFGPSCWINLAEPSTADLSTARNGRATTATTARIS